MKSEVTAGRSIDKGISMKTREVPRWCICRNDMHHQLDAVLAGLTSVDGFR